MRFFDRGRVPPPRCLDRYQPGETWDALRPEDRTELLQALEAVRGARCAYCDCDLNEQRKKPHLEHFVQRSRAPQLTFDWSNLFWSCSKPDSCGKAKDVAKYDDACLLKPDLRDPRRLLHFSSDGAVFPRANLSSLDREMAQTTIEVFQLNTPRLRQMRRSHLASLENEALEVFAISDHLAEIERYWREADLDTRPFSAACLDLVGLGPDQP